MTFGYSSCPYIPILSSEVDLCPQVRMLSICAACEEGVQYFLRGTVGDTINPKDMWHGGANYPRISCTGGAKKGGCQNYCDTGNAYNYTLVIYDQ